MENLEKLIEYSEYILRRYYRIHGSTYKKAEKDYEDLKTICALVIWKILQKYKNKPYEELKKIASVAVGRKLNKIYIKAKKRKAKLVILESERKQLPIEGIEEDIEPEENIENYYFEFEPYNEKKGGGASPGRIEITLDEVKKIVESEAFRRGFHKLNKNILFDLLYYYFVEDMTMTQIAKKYGETRQNVSRLIIKTCKKLRKYF